MKEKNIFVIEMLRGFIGIMILTILVCASPSSASLGTLQQNTNINLIQTCNNCTNCNITKIIAPNSSILLSNLIMTKDGTAYNYTLSKLYTLTIGEYKYCYYCWNAVESSAGCINFDITPSGKSLGVGFYILLMLLPYGLLLIGLWKQDITISLLGTMGLYLIGIFLLFNGIAGYKDKITEGFAIITLGLALYTSIRYAWEYFNV